MAGNPDFKDLFAAFNDADVRFLVVGAYAVIHYTEPRYTKDLDVWVEPTPTNAARVFMALAAFGAPLSDVSEQDFADPSVVFQIGIEPNRIDVLTGIAGLDFAPAWDHSLATTYDGIPIRVLSIDDILLAKRNAGRPQDLLDIDKLERCRRSGRGR
jgi:hypothetical protein